jgi:hypothetical protein
MQITPLTSFRLRAVALILLGISIFSIRASAQAAPPPACDYILQEIGKGNLEPSYLSNLNKGVTCFWEFALQSQPKTFHDTLRAQAAAQKKATTSQAGAPSGSNGTTSAVSKPITPLALATEYGGITTSTSNQTMTLQTTLDGIPTALLTHGDVPYCWSELVKVPGCIGSSTLQWLDRFGVGVTANTSSSTQNVSGTAKAPQGTAQQASLHTAGATSPSLSSVFTKITLWRGAYKLPDKGPDGNETSAEYIKLVRALREVSLNGDLPDEVAGRYGNWRKNCIDTNPLFAKDNLAGADLKKRSDLFARYYSQVVRVLFYGSPESCSPGVATPLTSSDIAIPNALSAWQKNLIDAIENYEASMSIFNAQLTKMLAAAAAPIVSLEYNFNTPLNQPTTSTIRLVGSKAFGPKICRENPSDPKSTTANLFTETMNVGGNFYNSTPSNVPGAGAFRDLQAGSETDVVFCTSSINVVGSFLGNSTLGFTYYYQDQVSPSILKVTPGTPLPGISIIGLASSTSSVFATKGPINFVQLKYGLGTGKNVKFPIAVSWSNRTDLITHSIWRAQFGVSYDFSSLLSSSGAGADNSK